MCRKLCNFVVFFRIVCFLGCVSFRSLLSFSFLFLSSALFSTLHRSNHGSASHFPDCLFVRIVLIGFAPPFPPSPSLLLCTGLLWPVLCVFGGERDVAQRMVPFPLLCLGLRTVILMCYFLGMLLPRGVLLVCPVFSVLLPFRCFVWRSVVGSFGIYPRPLWKS